jgi:hypothetical protein
MTWEFGAEPMTNKLLYIPIIRLCGLDTCSWVVGAHYLYQFTN